MRPTFRTLPFSWRSDGPVLLLAMLLPTALTFVYFVWFSNAGTKTAGIYFVSKVFLLFLPIVWYRKLAGVWPRLPFFLKPGWFMGLCFGLVTLSTLLGLYHFWLKDSTLFIGVADKVSERLRGTAITTFWQFMLMAVFISIIHSALEEYYWRWFVFDRLGAKLPMLQAAIISSIGFVLHHIIVLNAYANPDSKWLLLPLFSFAIGFGGFVWALIYNRYRSLLGCWIAHFFADLAIMLVGYHLCRDYFA